MTLEEYRKKLSFHDWFYAYSDDPTSYRKGAAQRNELLAARKELDPDWAIWNEKAPADFRQNK